MELAAEGLVKAYHRRRVVDGISLKVSKGEIVGLLGPNGAGKTTTFYMLLGLVRAEKGRVSLNGDDITPLTMHRRARLGLGYLPQEPSVFRKLSVEQNLLAVLELLPLSAQQRRERMESLLEEFSLTHVRNSNGQVLSGGERRRVEIARALATRPSFILLDEPFTGVDPIAVADLQDLILHLRSQEIGILVTDHNVRETLAITDRAYIIHEGEILTSGPSSALPNDPIARKFYLGDRFSL
ncbi:MAG: LPS export ABC transporter ATP-binding protein [Armatimonadetes bacterium]|nr:LPS export ABC transporter ATP-binding protein [Armatimonadota bacterium]NIO74606.1 LPS export ABC transporter ATP-binding protein [Armatimonadota bacterium]NIO96561.1 LPS export ABC transporter ATP-binding protein [Armatimonadota bacterium]